MKLPTPSSSAVLLSAAVLFVPCQSVPTVTVTNGTYSGLHSTAYNQDIFLGVPYAQSTGGQNRFKSLSLNT